MDGHRKLSTAGACGLLAISALCWTADDLGMRAFDYFPHAYRCLIFQHNGRWVHVPCFWMQLARLGIAFVPLLLLTGLQRNWRSILGLSLANPGRTWRWTVATGLACVAGVLVFVGGVEMWFWLADTRPPWQELDVLHFYSRDQLVPLLWQMVVMCPLVEETLYRALPVPALEKLGGWRSALVGSGLIWAALHWFYGMPIFLAPFYFVTSALTTCIFLRTRSLLPCLAIHAVFNLTVVLAWYFVVLGGSY